MHTLHPVRIEGLEVEFDLVRLIFALLTHRRAVHYLINRFRWILHRAGSVVLVPSDH